MYVCFLNFSSTDSRTVNVRAYRYSVFYNLAPRPIKYRVSVPIPNFNAAKFSIKLFYFIYLTVYLVSQQDKYEIMTETRPFKNS